VEHVGDSVSNVVQTEIKLGVSGGDLHTISNTVAQAWNNGNGAFVHINWTATTDSNGVVLDFQGPGGHAAEGTKGALTFSIEAFRFLSKNSTYKYYLPHNTTNKELDLFTSVRSRWDIDLPLVESAAVNAVKPYVSSIEWDTTYLTLEPSPYLGQRVMDIMTGFGVSFPALTIAPAATDAGWIQRPVVDSTTRKLVSEKRPTLHANFGICPQPSGAGCPFNHEPGFKDLSGTDLAYSKTEVMARTIAQIAIELAADPAKMAKARALVA
jgi:hypothetical protein